MHFSSLDLPVVGAGSIAIHDSSHQLATEDCKRYQERNREPFVPAEQEIKNSGTLPALDYLLVYAPWLLLH
jgi:hypothetical protein